MSPLESTYIDYDHSCNELYLQWTLLSRPVDKKMEAKQVDFGSQEIPELKSEHTCSLLDLSDIFGRKQQQQQDVLQSESNSEMQHQSTGGQLDLTYPLLGRPKVENIFEREREREAEIFEMPFRKAA